MKSILLAHSEQLREQDYDALSRMLVNEARKEAGEMKNGNVTGRSRRVGGDAVELDGQYRARPCRRQQSSSIRLRWTV